MEKFKLQSTFIDTYKNKKAPFGFNGLGELVCMRTYSRIKEDGTNEKWFEIIQRVVEGVYTIQKKWILDNGKRWSHVKAQKSAQEMYERIFTMKFLPPGRGLWTMGTSVIEEKGLFAAANNCGYLSTEDIDTEGSKPFSFLMDASMLGVGVGFDTKGAGKLVIKGPSSYNVAITISDDREGWVDSVDRLIDAFLFGNDNPIFDYSLIRLEGEPIKGFGGTASGPKPLIDLHESIRSILGREIGSPISITAIADVMNNIGKAVVAGNVRRTALIIFGDPASEEYLDLKNYKVNPHREDFGWTSNNSVFAEIGMDYSKVAERIKINGEPGVAWLKNMQGYSRMNGLPDYKDWRVRGGNPCLEQSLENKQLCTLVETFPANHESLEDYLKTLKFAYLYGKTITLGKTHWPETNEVMLRNRRIGCSVSGIAQFISKRGIDELRVWLESGYEIIDKYDVTYSEWFGIPRSIKKTSLKPSGTVSLLAGATPGLHYPESRFYIRRMRLSKTSNLLDMLKNAGYHLEEAFGSEESTMVVEIPVDVGEGVRTLADVSMWEQLALAAFMQKYWADNQVSATITFDPKTEGH